MTGTAQLSSFHPLKCCGLLFVFVGGFVFFPSQINIYFPTIFVLFYLFILFTYEVEDHFYCLHSAKHKDLQNHTVTEDAELEGT